MSRKPGKECEETFKNIDIKAEKTEELLKKSVDNTEEIFKNIDISAEKTEELFKKLVENNEVIFKDIMKIFLAVYIYLAVVWL